MFKQDGVASLVALGILLASFGVGMVFEHFVNEKNHPVEQAVEKILREYGIEHDFSEDKTAQQKDQKH